MNEHDKAMIRRYDDPETPDRVHCPELEQWAVNPMPKSGWRALRLFRFKDTDLFQWWGKPGTNSNQGNWSPVEEAAGDVFRIRDRTAPLPGPYYLYRATIKNAVLGLSPAHELIAVLDMEQVNRATDFLRDQHGRECVVMTYLDQFPTVSAMAEWAERHGQQVRVEPLVWKAGVN